MMRYTYLFALACLTVSSAAEAKISLALDSGAAYVMPTGVEGESRVVGPDLSFNIGDQVKDFLRLSVGVGVDPAAPQKLLSLRPAARLFPFGGSLYGQANIPVTPGGGSQLGLMVGGGYELKLLGLIGAYAEGGLGYAFTQGQGGEEPVEGRAGLIFLW